MGAIIVALKALLASKKVITARRGWSRSAWC